MGFDIGFLDPATNFIDNLGKTLGLPPEVMGVVKVGVGSGTGNVLMVADGVQDVGEALAKNKSAHTEHQASPSCQKKAEQSYAPSGDPWGLGDKVKQAAELARQARENAKAGAEPFPGLGSILGLVDQIKVLPPPPPPPPVVVICGGHGTPPVSPPRPETPPQPPPGKGCDSLDGLSIEEMAEKVLMEMMGDFDKQIKDTLQEIKAKKGNGGEGLEELQAKLQRLMEKRKQMFELMSNLSMKFNEMARSAISNLAKA